MTSNVVVTYKRKRLFSRSDNPHISDTQSEVSKSSADCVLQNNGPQLGICHQPSDDNVQQCENCDSHSETHAGNLNSAEKSNGGERSSMDSAAQSNGEEKSAEETLPVVPDQLDPSQQIKGTSLSEETNKLDKDQESSLCDNVVKKRKLITFCRRSKRSRGVAAPDISSGTETPPAASGSVDMEGGKKPHEDLDKSCSRSALAPASATVVQTENPPDGEAKNTAAAPKCDEEMPLLQEKVSTDVQDNLHKDVGPEILCNEDVKSRSMHSDVSEKKVPHFALDLSVSPHGARDIDCNRPLDDWGSDENHLLAPSEVPSIGSTSKLMEKMPTQQVHQDSSMRAVRDKGKHIVDPQPVLTATSCRNNYMQLFPEISEKLIRYQPSSSDLPNFHGLSVQSDQTVDNRPFLPPPYQWPHIQAQPRESFHDFLQPSADRTQSYSRQNVMLDNILTRARAVRGNGSGFLGKFDYPTTWSEEELDSLWIGVRRHGRGNWDAILKDRRLNFSPWRSIRDLAERWQEEQAQLFCNTKINEPLFGPGLLYGPLPHTGPGPSISTSYLTGWMGILQPPLGVPSSSHADPTKGSLPHWLRAAVEVPPRPFDPTQIAGPSVEMGRLSQPGPQNAAVRRGKRPVNEHPGTKEEQVIIIPSDASSEETISDDHGIRP